MFCRSRPAYLLPLRGTLRDEDKRGGTGRKDCTEKRHRYGNGHADTEIKQLQ